MIMKPLKFVGSSLDDLRNFPDEARRAAGFELRAVQTRNPSHHDIDLARQRYGQIGGKV